MNGEVRLACPLGLFCSLGLPAVTLSSGRATHALATLWWSSPEKLKELFVDSDGRTQEGLSLAALVTGSTKVCGIARRMLDRDFSSLKR